MLPCGSVLWVHSKLDSNRAISSVYNLVFVDYKNIALTGTAPVYEFHVIFILSFLLYHGKVLMPGFFFLVPGHLLPYTVFVLFHATYV